MALTLLALLAMLPLLRMTVLVMMVAGFPPLLLLLQLLWHTAVF